ncbi:hypothetical protein [Xanthomonas indica]|uniref:Uncharacterized protein n=1 Tax=Xanthomonas indica TaxID=2912242 RepID=A0AAU8I177_9XANT|nr:hypothetical protein [Xanthomonas indica]MCI2261911.1 hypothetical protein [Xanthomonas indica]
MSPPANRDNAHDSQQLSHTPDKIHNDDAQWKDRDQPDSDPKRDHADPEHDYPRPDGSE